MALVLESRFTKDQILELYLNDVVLGQRGPFAIHGVAEASRIFFGKDVQQRDARRSRDDRRRHPVAVAPVAVPQPRARPRAPQRRAQGDGRRGYISVDDAEKAAQRAARRVVARARGRGAVLRRLRQPAGRRTATPACCATTPPSTSTRRSICTCSAWRRKPSARDSRRRQASSRPSRSKGTAQVALVAVDPRPARSWRWSAAAPTTSRSTTARSPRGGSRARSSSRSSTSRRSKRWREEGARDLTPATVVVDEPTTFKDGDKDYTPGNYQNEYDGPITLRRALALSRNIVAIKVAEATGYDRVADLWKKVGVGTPAKAYPSIALGVFEASPLEIAEAYTVFPNDGDHAAAPVADADRRGQERAPDRTASAPKPVAGRTRPSWSRT